MCWEHRSFTRQCTRQREGEIATVDHKRIDLELNALGTEGWQLVAVVPLVEESLVSAMAYFLKRECEDTDVAASLVGSRR
jgi:hypothetical protein